MTNTHLIILPYVISRIIKEQLHVSFIDGFTI